FQFLDGDWLLVLDITVTLGGECRRVIVVRPLPSLIVRNRAEGSRIQRASREREHRHGFADPNSPAPEMLLPAPDLLAIFFFGEYQVGLDPRNALAGEKQQLAHACSIHPAIFVELLPNGWISRLQSALHGNTVGAGQEVETFFIPKIDARLDADLNRP